MYHQLLIAYSFPPIINAESVVTANMVNGLSKLGWKTTVLTVQPNPSLFSIDWDLMRCLPPDVEIITSPITPIHYITKLLKKMQLDTFAQILNALPDAARWWYHGAVTSMQELIENNTFDIVQSRALPITDHLLGLYSKNHYGLPWIAHFSDPWIESPFYSCSFPWVIRLHQQWQYRCIEQANAITFTTDAATSAVMEKYPDTWKQKCHTIAHGFVKYNKPDSMKTEFDTRNFNILYLGSFYGNRTPQNLFEGITLYLNAHADTRNIQFWLIGRMPHLQYQTVLKQKGLDSYVFLRESLPYTDAQACAFGADLLLTIDTTSENPNLFLPSKMIEYLGYGKPIWGIVYPHGLNGKLLTTMGCPISDIERPESIATTLQNLYHLWKCKSLVAPDQNNRQVQQFSIHSTSVQLASVMESILN